MQNRQGKDYALAGIVMRMVIKADGRLQLHPRAAEGFEMAMDALFQHPVLDPKEEIEAVVRLVGLFERDRAFELADAIIDLLAHDDRALTVLGISSVRKSREVKRQFAKLVSGNRATVVAPVFGTQAPRGTVKLSTFLDPGRQVRRRPPPPAHLARVAR